MEIKKCTAIISGGASGLGRACVDELVKMGAKAAIFDLQEPEIWTDSVIFCKTDVSDEKSVKNSIDKTIEAFGSIQIAISCAGIGIPFKVLTEDGPMSIEKFNKTIQINLVGTMNMIRLGAEQMVKNEPNEDGEKGVVINTASIAAFEGQTGQAAYTASKSAIVGMTLPIAREFANYGIRVMTIAPGLFNTPMLAGLPDKVKESLAKMIPFPKRLGEPSEYAKLAIHIVENPILNGETIRLDSAIRMAGK
jgi:3-hydroxyacyl-CoA dehydrogenase / 3-hydroxy-2-methylbutyryl-CoA dehydrogenase